jgi:hypothetical protein
MALSGDLPGPPRSLPDSLVDGKNLGKSPTPGRKSNRSSPSLELVFIQLRELIPYATEQRKSEQKKNRELET